MNYSLGVKPGEKVLVEMYGSEREIVKCLVEEVAAAGGFPYVQFVDHSVLARVIGGATKDQIEQWPRSTWA